MCLNCLLKTLFQEKIIETHLNVHNKNVSLKYLKEPHIKVVLVVIMKNIFSNQVDHKNNTKQIFILSKTIKNKPFSFAGAIKSHP